MTIKDLLWIRPAIGSITLCRTHTEAVSLPSVVYPGLTIKKQPNEKCIWRRGRNLTTRTSLLYRPLRFAQISKLDITIHEDGCNPIIQRWVNIKMSVNHTDDIRFYAVNKRETIAPQILAYGASPMWKKRTRAIFVIVTSVRRPTAEVSVLCDFFIPKEIYHATSTAENDFSRLCRPLGAVSIRKTVLPGMAIPMLKIRRPDGRLIFNMEIAIRR